MKKGFTLVELLVSVAVLSILGVIFLVVFSNSLRGGNKAQIVLAIKQNGQSVLETMDKTIRGSDDVVCVDLSGTTIVIGKDGVYTRYQFIDPTPTDNGKIQQDNPDPEISEISCETSLIEPIALTDTNTETGVSVFVRVRESFFTRNKSSGFKDVITIKFDIAQGVGVTPGTSSVIDPIHFETSIQLR